MTRAVFLGALLFLPACDRRSDHFCGQDPKMGCTCQSEPYRLRAGERTVKECGPPPADLRSYRCCHDVGEGGLSTQCRCESALCYRSSDDLCACGMRARSGEVGNVVTSCEPSAKATHCCKTKGGCECSATSCTEGSAVARCTADDVHPEACAAPASHEAKSCDGLKWKSKG